MRRWAVAVGAFAAVLAGAGTAIVGPSRVALAATTINVNCSADTDNGTATVLQTAIADASAGDTLVISGRCSEPPVTTPDGYTVFSIDKNLTLEGQPDSVLIPSVNASGNRFGRIVEVTGGAQVTLENLRITWGNVAGEPEQGNVAHAGFGGGLYVTAGSQATVVDDTIDSNHASNGGSATQGAQGWGGGIYNAGTLTLHNSHLGNDNTASTTINNNGVWEFVGGGGGIYNASGATATVSESVLDGDSSSLGGGIDNAGTLTLDRSLIHNSDGIRGGGISNASGATLTVTNSTLADNQVNGQWPGESGAGCGPAYPGYGGGIDNAGTLTVAMSTLIDNSLGLGGENQGCIDDPGGAGGGIDNSGTESVGGSILSANTVNVTSQHDESGPDCADTNPTGSTSRGYNIVNDTVSGLPDCAMFTAPTDKTGTDPQLGGLGYNGGAPVGQESDGNPSCDSYCGDQQTTLTAIPQSGSPVIDAVPTSTCESFLGANPTDERTVPRPQGPACDIGAIEVSPPSLSATNETYTCTDGSPCTADAGHGLLAGDRGLPGTTLVVAGNNGGYAAPFPAVQALPGSLGYYNQPSDDEMIVNLDGSWSFNRSPDLAGNGADSFSYYVIDLATNEMQAVDATVDEVTPSTTTLTSSANPSPVGNQVTYTATVSPTYGDANSPGGDFLESTVAFTDNGTTISGCGAQPLAEVVNGSTVAWQATCSVTYTSGGTHPIQASFPGCAGFCKSGVTWLPSTSKTVDEVIGSGAAGLVLTGVSPTRVCDTRPSSQSGLTDVCTGHTLAPGVPLTVPLPTGVVPADAGAVVANVTVTNASGPGFLTVYPAGQSPPASSNLNFTGGQTVANQVTVAVGSSGGQPAIAVVDGTGTQAVDVIVDIEGYDAPPGDSPAGGYHPLTPARLADTRCAASPQPGFCAGEHLPSQNAGEGTIGPAGQDTLTVTGVGGVPATGVSAVAVNLTAVSPTAAGFLTAAPGGSIPPGGPPGSSTLNFTAGEVLANKVIVPVSSSGTISIFNHAGNTDIVVDVDGWFSNASGPAGATFTPVSPTRLADTRCGASPQPSFCAGEHLPTQNAGLNAPAGGQSITVAIGGTGTVPANLNAAVVDLVDISPPSSGNFLTAYPTGSAVPPTSDVNYVNSDTYNIVPGAAYATTGTSGAVNVLNGPTQPATTNIITDLFGYYTPPAG